LEKLSIAQANYLNEDELLDFLKKDLEIDNSEDLEVWGILDISLNNSTDKNFYTLKNVKTKNKLDIEYPILDLNYNKTIHKNGIFIPFEIGEQLIKSLELGQELFLRCKLILADKHVRENHNNPMLLRVASDYIKILKKVSKHVSNNLEVHDDLDNYYLEEDTLNKIKVVHDLDELLVQKNEENHNKKSELKKIKKMLEDEFSELKEKHSLNIQHLSEKETKKQKALDKVEEAKNLINKEIETKKIEIKTLILKEENMGKKLEKLRTFIKDKADTLLDLEFIDQEEYDNLLMIQNRDKSDEIFVYFKDDLLENKQTAISHIQAYLFEKDIVYPRYILEDFFALIQTNDLIILAGESGSGKTNLVKSFADAVGGKSFIIPVKPNWTSSEDLLGYYNPLEKKYLTTPFLEALLEAKDNSEIPYFICLDEMNLARVEYYFADFLSLLEERGESPEIKLYSEDESSHILSEFKNVMDAIEHVKEKYKKKNIVNFIQLLQDEEINKELTRVFGFSDKDSLIKYHTDLRRMLSGILNTPSSISFPPNVRIIGAINIDETTHYLSPKILDRAHIMKFDSPLLQNWDTIEAEIEDVEDKDLKIRFKIEDLGKRKKYPSYNKEDEFCKIITTMTKEYFSPLGIEVGLRTIRQGLNYQEIFREQGSDEELILNNFVLHKILPKMTFDGNKQVNEESKSDLLNKLTLTLESYINQDLVEEKSINTITELRKIMKASESNDGIVNYWA